MDEPLAMRGLIVEAQRQVLGVADRLHSSPAPDLVMTAFAAELEQQDALFEGIGLADIAHTVMLIEVGVIPADEGAALLSFLLKLQPRPRDFVPDPALGDMYTNREAWLSTRTSAAGWLGAGRARREATTTGYLVTTRLIGAIIETGRAIVDCAERHRDSLMPDYTYLQASQPTTFAHFLLGFGCALTRDLDRARALFARVNLSPAGCGSSNGSILPQDRERLAALLGFDGLVRHARDGRVLGAEAVGTDAVDKCIDIMATAIWAGRSVDVVAELDLAYAPPFSPVMPPVHVVAELARKHLPLKNPGGVVELAEQPR